MADIAERIVTEGIVEITDRALADTIRLFFSDIQQHVTRDSLKDIPVAIGGNDIRGRFVSKPNGRRDGLYYGPEVDPFLPKNAQVMLHCILAGLRSFASIYLGQICRKYRIDESKLRTGTCFDTVTLAWYDEMKSDEPALLGHTDFGLLTIGMSDAEGLELETSTGWKKIPGNTPYVHTGQWLQTILKDAGVQNVHPARHRVMHSPRNRFFLGLFLDPAMESVHNGKTFLEFVQHSFAESYPSEKAN